MRFRKLSLSFFAVTCSVHSNSGITAPPPQLVADKISYDLPVPVDCSAATQGKVQVDKVVSVPAEVIFLAGPIERVAMRGATVNGSIEPAAGGYVRKTEAPNLNLSGGVILSNGKPVVALRIGATLPLWCQPSPPFSFELEAQGAAGSVPFTIAVMPNKTANWSLNALGRAALRRALGIYQSRINLYLSGDSPWYDQRGNPPPLETSEARKRPDDYCFRCSQSEDEEMAVMLASLAAVGSFDALSRGLGPWPGTIEVRENTIELEAPDGARAVATLCRIKACAGRLYVTYLNSGRGTASRDSAALSTEQWPPPPARQQLPFDLESLLQAARSGKPLPRDLKLPPATSVSA